jgi:hypothetical protein
VPRRHTYHFIPEEIPVFLLREVYIDAYPTSAENHRTLRAEIETPEKAAPVYRDFVHKAARRSVLTILFRSPPGVGSSGSNHPLSPAAPAKEWTCQSVDIFVILFDDVFALKRLYGQGFFRQLFQETLGCGLCFPHGRIRDGGSPRFTK